MKYTTIPKVVQLELGHITKNDYNKEEADNSPSAFALHCLGITPYTYQHQIMRLFDPRLKLENDRIIICKSRQIGMSVCVGCLAVWFAITNQSKSGIFNNTKVGIVSRDDRAAKKLMASIQKLCFNGFHGITNMIVQQKGIPLTKYEIHFQNKSFVKCFPPTDATRGETFDFLIVDEAAFVDGEIFKDAMEPTVSAVGGKIILSSTPKGQSGMYFEKFDPFGLMKEHEYKRFWYHWKMSENEGQRRLTEQKRKFSKAEGNLKNFQQEYEAQFTVDQEAFFDDNDVEKGVDENLVEVYESRDNCSLGIDYGGSNSATALTVVKNIKNKIYVLFQFAEKDFDLNLIVDPNFEHSIMALMKRYNISSVVVDDCPQGDAINKGLENKGYPVVRFDFNSDRYLGERNRGLYMFRTALKQNRLKYPLLRTLMAEMKTMQEVRMSQGNYMKIKAPKGYNDDRVMSLMMASFPFLTTDGSFGSTVVDYKKALEDLDINKTNTRIDPDWDKWANSKEEKIEW